MQEMSVENRIKEMMIESGAYLKGHFLLTSGKHSEYYMQCAMLLRFPKYAAYAGEQIARNIEKLKPEVIVSPAIGGLIIGHEVARYLDIPFLFCERDENRMKLRRFPVPEGKRVVVVEDVITTGGSVHEVGRLMESQGCTWAGTACIVNRSGGNHVLPEEPISLWKVTFPVYEANACPLCASGSSPVKPGSRKL